jgi:hypothetical protein
VGWGYCSELVNLLKTYSADKLYQLIVDWKRGVGCENMTVRRGSFVYAVHFGWWGLMTVK